MSVHPRKVLATFFCLAVLWTSSMAAAAGATDEEEEPPPTRIGSQLDPNGGR